MKFSFLFVAQLVSVATARSKPNVLVLLADDFGFADLGVTAALSGTRQLDTPNLDGLANKGVLFTSWYAGFHICSPSRAGLLTGRNPVRIGTAGNSWLGDVFRSGSVGGLPRSEKTIANLAKDHGYMTAMVGKWHLGSRKKYNPLHYGFDQFFGIPYSVDVGRTRWTETLMVPYDQNAVAQPVLEGQDIVEQPAVLATFTERLTDHATSFISKAVDAGKPFLLYFAFGHAHVPQFRSEKFCDSKFGPYGGAVREMDHYAGQMLKVLEEQGVENNTFVIFTSDNGPWQSLGYMQGGSAGLFRDGKGTTWEGGYRVPAIVRYPPLTNSLEGVHMDQILSSFDIYPTIRHLLAGLETNPSTSDEQDNGKILDGKSFLPLLSSGNRHRDIVINECFFYYKGPNYNETWDITKSPPIRNNSTDKVGLWAVRCGDYKMHFIINPIPYRYRYEDPANYEILKQPFLFNLKTNPEEFPILAVDPSSVEYKTQSEYILGHIRDHLSSFKYPRVNQIARGKRNKYHLCNLAVCVGCTWNCTIPPGFKWDEADKVCPGDIITR